MVFIAVPKLLNAVKFECQHLKRYLLLACTVLFMCNSGFAQFFEDQNPLQTIKKQDGAILSLAFQPDGKVFASGAEDKTFVLWSYPEIKEIKTIVGQNSGVKSIVYAPDLKYMYTGGDKSIRVYQTNGEFVKMLGGPATTVWKISFNSENNRFVIGSYDKTIRIVDLASGKLLTPLTGHTKNALAVCYSPDNKIIASGSLDETIKIWNASDATVLKTMTGHGGNIYDIVFTNDSKYVISASADNSARLWDINEGKTIKTFPGHEKFVFCLAVSPDNAYLLTGSQDATIKLWDIKSGACLYTFYGHKDAVNALAFHPSGDTFISGSADKTIMVWKMAPEIFIAHYFSDAFDAAIKKSELFAPKGENETKADYKTRMEKAGLFRQDLIDQLYSKYILEIKGK